MVLRRYIVKFSTIVAGLENKDYFAKIVTSYL